MLFFFFQAEDGIRDATVTGVQTCALPISSPQPAGRARRLCRTPCLHERASAALRPGRAAGIASCDRRLREDPSGDPFRSEERRVGKEGRSRWATEHQKKK